MSEVKQSGELFDPAQVKTITFDYLEGVGLSPGHVFITINERQFTLLKAGDFVSKSFIQKYKSKGLQTLFLSELAEKQHIEAMKERWKEFKNAKGLEDKNSAIRNLKKLFCNRYWKKGEIAPHFYCFVIATFSAFNRVSSEELEKIESVSTDGFTRCVHVASIAAFNATVLGIDSWEQVSDIFHAALFLDASLLLDDFSFRIREACEMDRVSPEKSKLFIQNKLDRNRAEKFKAHPKASYDLVKAKFSECFYDVDMARVIIYHHEHREGGGFPVGIEYQAASDWEVAVLMADRLIPYKGELYQAEEKDGFYKGLYRHLKKSQVINILPLSRGINIFEREMEDSTKEVVDG